MSRPRLLLLLFIPLLALGLLLSVKEGIISTGGESLPSIKSQILSAAGGNAPQRVTLAAYQRSNVHISRIHESGFEFNAVAPHWKETNAGEERRTFSLRISSNKRDWSDWYEIEALKPQRDDAPHSEQMFAETPLFAVGKYIQYKVELNRPSIGAPTPVLSDFRFTYIDSRQPGRGKIRDLLASAVAPPAVAASSPAVISRAGWGSPDPTGKLYRGTGLFWSPYHTPTKQIFVHHTVNSNNPSDPAAVVRGIWQYHTHTLGWGDIGYNYLVDQHGKIYEGRAGGDNVTGGHVFGYNTGSMGVALLGCFQSTDSTCKNLNGGTVTGPSSPMLDGLTSLLAGKAKGYEIDPQAQQVFCRGDGSGCLTLPTIAAHRDALITSCPGDLAYKMLPTIRTQTASKKGAFSGYSAKQLDYRYTDLADTGSRQVTLRFQNTGTTTWSNTSNRVVLKAANPNSDASPYRSADWTDDYTPAILTEASVAPGSTGSFTFTLARPVSLEGNDMPYLRLVAEGAAEFGGYFGLGVVGPDHTSSYAGQSSYPALLPGQSAQVHLSYRNAGNTSWYDDAGLASAPAGTRPVHLATSHHINRRSPLGGAWGGDQNRPASLFGAVYEADGTTLAASQHIARPGQIAKFVFSVTARADTPAGSYREFYQPIAEGGTTMNDPWTFLDIRVDAAVYASSYAGQSGYPSIQQGQGAEAWLRYKNTGNVPWHDDAGLAAAPAGSKPVHLATSHAINRPSRFGLLWGGDRNRTGSTFSAVYEADGLTLAASQHMATPGQIIEFRFPLSAGYALPSGTYREFFQPIVEGGPVMNDPWTFLDVAVKSGVYASAYAGQSSYPQLSPGGQPSQAFLLYKNTGNAPWYDVTSVPKGSNPTVLATSHTVNRKSPFGTHLNGNWCGNSHLNRPDCIFDAVYESDGTTLAAHQHLALPGQVVRFGFPLQASTETDPGTYREFFQPILEGGPAMNDPWTFLNVDVK